MAWGWWASASFGLSMSDPFSLVGWALHLKMRLIAQPSNGRQHSLAAREFTFVDAIPTPLNCLAGGRVFPGLHHYAKFEVSETQDDFDIAVQSSDALVSMSIHAHRTNRFSTSSIFANLDEASAFFRAGSLGYSATSERTRFKDSNFAVRDGVSNP